MHFTKLIIVGIILCVSTTCNSSFFNGYGRVPRMDFEGNAGEPLFLTPLIEEGKIDQARKEAEVISEEMHGVKSYSGYLTVDKKYNSNMFFWFFPSTNDYQNDPVVLWLQGGPGATSLMGLLMENGPFVPKKHGLKLRKYSWTDNHSVIYIDNPVGTGYSFANEDGYCQNQTAVGENLYSALLQFFQLFPELQRNEFFVTGESYAGKYVPSISYTIHTKNPTAEQKINLKGFAIGNGLCDPEHQLKYGDYLYEIGLIDSHVQAQFHQLEQHGVDYIKKKEWVKAFEIFDSLLNGDLNNHTSIFLNATGFTNYFYYLASDDNLLHLEENMGKFIQSSITRRAIHVGNVTFNSENSEVEKKLISDMMQSVAPWISTLLSHYRGLIYNGQLDIIVAYPLTVNFLKNLPFSSEDEYKTASRHIWHVENEIAGYFKTAGNLTEVMVRNAGHMVPTYQPQWSLDLITRFTRNKPYN